MIGYGAVQSLAPALLTIFLGNNPPRGGSARNAAFLLSGLTAIIAISVHLDLDPRLAIIGGLALFGLLFAINSSVHSYLILAYAHEDQVAMDVGFYYMANASGRLIGTILSGIIFQFAGLTGCLWVSMLFLLAAATISMQLPKKNPSIT